MSDKHYGWKEQLAVGAKGEIVVQEWLRSRGMDVVDVAHDPFYQKRGIDLVVVRDNDQWHTEVKTDTYANDRVFFETLNAEGLPGALFKSRAQVWYIYKVASNGIWEVDPARLIAFLWEHRDTAKNFPVRNDRGKIRAWGTPISAVGLAKAGAVWYNLQHDTTDSDHETDAPRSGT